MSELFTYEELPIRVGFLKRAAIDAYMKSEGYAVFPDNYYRKLDNITTSVIPPDENGSGGGACEEIAFGVGGSVTTRYDKKGADFNRIRSMIDGMLVGWISIPDGSDLDTVYNVVTSIGGSLASEAADGIKNLPIAPDNRLRTDVKDVISHVTTSGWSGCFHEEFKYRIIALDGICRNLCQVVLMIAAVAEGECEMYNKARKDVCQIVGGATTKFHRYAYTQEPDQAYSWPKLFRVVGALCEAASYLPGAYPAMEGAAAVFNLLAELAPETEIQPPAESVDDFTCTMATFDEALVLLADATRQEDMAANMAMGDLADFVKSGSAGQFTWPVHYGQIDPSNCGSPSGSVIAPTPAEGEATADLLIDIQSVIATAADDLVKKPNPYAWERPHPIGLYPNGPSPGWVDAQVATSRAVDGFSKDVWQCCDIFRTVVDHFDQADREAKRRMEETQAIINQIQISPVRVPGYGEY